MRKVVDKILSFPVSAHWGFAGWVFIVFAFMDLNDTSVWLAAIICWGVAAILRELEQ